MYSKEEAYSKIAELIERFSAQADNYKRDYNETQTRQDFINPFFEALGWDMNNKQGAWEAYREVIHEDKLKVGGVTKAPDYSFRLVGGQRLFFVEAKKPSIVIKDDVAPAYQVRLYGWNAKLAISVVTDFEEFAVYECSKKPLKTDKASKARINYFTYTDYLKEFDFFWNTFSKEQVIKGGLIKFQQTDKKGTATVDKDFLENLDVWRKELAANIYKNNDTITEDELNYAVQQTIDRIIFLRIAEDRGLEPYGQLNSSLQNTEQYKELFRQFRIADDKYNSGLFHFKKEKDNSKEPDNISGKLIIENKVIKSIISSLYPPQSEFLFNVMPVEILGSAYEQFLGKQIIVKGSRATIEEKPEVRKAGGVYYTPQYIVEYIVENTVGKLCNNKTPKEISKLKIVDPACGSGSFLLGAYQYLLNWHSRYYTNNPQKGKQKDAVLTPDGSLTTAEKKRILLNNIYGVDIDRNATEVTKLSLLLKCMEGETTASVNTQMTFFHERILPSLENNIKSGNSLIDVDFYDGQIDYEPEIEKKVKPFNWQRAFPNVFNLKQLTPNQDFKKQLEKVKKLEDDAKDLIDKYIVEEREQKYGILTGFDIVIGNPPYGALFSEHEFNYFKNRYQSAVWRGESYLMFIEKAIKLLKEDGLLGFIIPDTILNLSFTQPTREILLRNSKLQELVGLPSNVFLGAVVDTVILLTEKKEYTNQFHPSNVWVKTFGKKQTIAAIENPQKEFFVKTKQWFEQASFNLQTDNAEKKLLDKIEYRKEKVKDISEIFSGIKTYEVGKGIPAQTEKVRDQKPYTSSIKISEKWKPFFDGKHIGRYQLFWNKNNWIHYGKWLAAPRVPENFEGEKILIRKIIGKTIIATYSHETSYCNTLLFALKLKSKSYSYKSILAILNSNLISWYFRNKFQISNDDTFPQIMIRDILQFPIPAIDKKNDNDIVKLVETMLQLNKEKQQTTTPDKLDQLNTRIQYTDDKINKLVYTLYGLSEEEVAIVEGR